MASTSGTSNKVTAYLKKIIGKNSIGELIPLTSGEKVVIGRNKPGVQIWINDVNISRSHCILMNRENGWFIKDLQSMNGTFLAGFRIMPEIFHPLRDGVEIHLGPPEDAPAAFIFLTKLPNEQSYEMNLRTNSQRNKERTTHLPNLVICNSIKRPSGSEDTGTNESFSPRKRTATSSSSPTTPSSRVQDVFEAIEDNGDLSDCSISSLDSLKTRIRKRSAKKDMNRNSRNKDSMNTASTSASPQLRPSSNTIFDNKPSTSATPSEMLDRKKNIQKPTISKEFALLNTLFNESESSTPETLKGEDSQSLLNDSKMLIDCEPYPFSQPLAIETAENKQKTNKNKMETEKEDSVEEKLQKANLEIKKLKKDKLYLSRLVKDLKSDEKTRFQVEFQKLLEEELMCNICTEVYMKAITLGCSHTFCDYCISEWKKKQKKCPICREKITSETKILVLDSFISKAVEQLDPGTQNRRKELAATREKAKATQKKKGKRSRGRNRRIQSESSDADEVRQTRGESSNGVGVQIRFSRNSSPSIQVLPLDDELGDMGSDFSDISDESDMSVEGFGYFGGYGRCYSCGRRGHWANGCPYM